ncbi:MAG TPA: hypothetical protein VLB00_16535 [Gemmatimonadales bacterium]|nr:hypothetical protein [Gemmatimonadales bacterium]
MSTRAFLALVRREVLRGKRSLIVLSVIAGLSLLVALTTSGPAPAIAVILAVLGSLAALGGPSGDLGADKLLGHLEADRVLPVSGRIIAAGRLTGAAIRLLPIGISAFALAVVIAGEVEAGPLEGLLLLGMPLGVYAFAAMFSWTLLALNARWQFRNLWWVPVTLMMGPQLLPSLLPPSQEAALELAIRSAGRALAEFAATPLGVILALLLITALPLAVFAGATALFASGLERYRFDANALAVQLGKAPTRELGAIGKGPLLAVARLRVRLSLEQQRRQAILLGILLVVMMVGPEELREFARVYVRVLAVLLPAAIALQLTQARGTGYLEGMQQLPHPAVTVALGHLLAVAVMAVPGAIVLLLGRAASGRIPGPVEGLMVWGWFMTGAWVAAVLAVWLKAKYLGILAALVAAMLIGVYALAGLQGVGVGIGLMVDAFRQLKQWAGIMLPIGAVVLVSTLGIPLFAHGLRTYQYRTK